MKEKPKSGEQGGPFMTKEELGRKAAEWQIDANAFENRRYAYFANRIEGREDPRKSIDAIHRISFLNEVIPALLQKKEKVMVLDIGAGAALFAEQIRKKFGKRVEVYSTGLSKQTARAFRKSEANTEFPKKLHPDDLKWRSIFELSDFEEFDLIIDTFGEQEYAVTDHGKDRVGGFEKYLRAVIAKLNPGGLASIFPASVLDNAQDGKRAKETISRLEKECGVQIAVIRNPDAESVIYREPLLKISKFGK